MTQPLAPSSSDCDDAPAQSAPADPWDGFLTGPENELAVAGVHALARGDREGLLPLVIHGPSGVGKSRLLAGLAAEWMRRQPGDAICRTDAASFAAACFNAAGRHARDDRTSASHRAQHEQDGDGWAELRDRFRMVGLLIIDDLEGLERIPLACDELVHTLDALEARGSALAVSCRTPPGRWPRGTWPARLVNRLIGGLAVRVDAPGLALRRRYVLERARASGLVLSADAIESLAGSADGYRTLDGWLARLVLSTRLGTGSRGSRRGPIAPLDLQAVAEALQDEVDLAAAGWTVEQIARAVAAKFGVRVSALRGPGRQAAIVEARHLAMHLARTHTNLSFAAIGHYFGRRDPATVRHAYHAATVRLAADPALAAVMASLASSRR